MVWFYWGHTYRPASKEKWLMHGSKCPSCVGSHDGGIFLTCQIALSTLACLLRNLHMCHNALERLLGHAVGYILNTHGIQTQPIDPHCLHVWRLGVMGKLFFSGSCLHYRSSCWEIPDSLEHNLQVIMFWEIGKCGKCKIGNKSFRFTVFQYDCQNSAISGITRGPHC